MNRERQSCRNKVDNASVDIRNYVDKPELQEKLLKQAKERVGKIKKQDIMKRIKEDLEETEKNYMHKHSKKNNSKQTGPKAITCALRSASRGLLRRLAGYPRRACQLRIRQLRASAA